MAKLKGKELGLSCMLNTEVGAVLAVMRRRMTEPNSHFHPPQDDNCDTDVLQSLKSLRGFIFNPQQEWRKIDPSIYLSPFVDVIQSDEVPAAATGVALSSILKILKLEIFDEKTPGAKETMNSAVTAITGCRFVYLALFLFSVCLSDCFYSSAHNLGNFGCSGQVTCISSSL